jgi:hypothetical protein
VDVEHHRGQAAEPARDRQRQLGVVEEHEVVPGPLHLDDAAGGAQGVEPPASDRAGHVQRPHALGHRQRGGLGRAPGGDVGHLIAGVDEGTDLPVVDARVQRDVDGRDDQDPQRGHRRSRRVTGAAARTMACPSRYELLVSSASIRACMTAASAAMSAATSTAVREMAGATSDAAGLTFVPSPKTTAWASRSRAKSAAYSCSGRVVDPRAEVEGLEALLLVVVHPRPAGVDGRREGRAVTLGPGLGGWRVPALEEADVVRAGADATREETEQVVGALVAGERPRQPHLVLDGQGLEHPADGVGVELPVEQVVARPAAVVRRVEQALPEALPAGATGALDRAADAGAREVGVRAVEADGRGADLADAEHGGEHRQASRGEQTVPASVDPPGQERLEVRLPDPVGRLGDDPPGDRVEAVELGAQDGGDRGGVVLGETGLGPDVLEVGRDHPDVATELGELRAGGGRGLGRQQRVDGTDRVTALEEVAAGLVRQDREGSDRVHASAEREPGTAVLRRRPWCEVRIDRSQRETGVLLHGVREGRRDRVGERHLRDRVGPDDEQQREGLRVGVRGVVVDLRG